MDAWELDEIEAGRVDRGVRYEEFLRVPDLSGGLYVLEAGATDPQSPHTEDELYYVVRGRARVTVGDDVRDVRPGSLVFVAATVPHRFHDITERLELLVVFGPAEGDRRADASPRIALGRGRVRRERLGQGQRQLRPAARLVVAEEHERVVAVREERLEAGRPGLELGRRVVVSSEPQVEERAGPSDRRRRLVLGQLGRAQRGTRRGQRRERLVDVPARVRELQRSSAGRAARRPGTPRAGHRRGATRRGPGTGPSRAAPRTPGTGPSARATPGAAP